MILYHKDSKEPIDAHPSQVESMKNDGWTEKPIKPTKKDEVKE